MSNVEHVTGNYTDGSQINNATSIPLGFYGTAPIAQRTSAATLTDTTVAVSTTSAIWGFSTSTQANTLIASVAALTADLKALGLVG